MLQKSALFNDRTFFLGSLSVLAVCAILFVNLLVAPLVVRVFEDRTTRDLELRSRLLAGSLNATVASLLEVNAIDAIPKLFDKVATDENVYAVALCGPAGVVYRSRQTPVGLRCEAGRSEASSLVTGFDEGRTSFLVSSFPFSTRQLKGSLVLVQDSASGSATHIDRRRNVALLVALSVIVGSALTIAMMLYLLHVWRLRMRNALAELRSGVTVKRQELENSPLGPELYQLIRDIDLRREPVDGDTVSWSADSLKKIIRENLSDTQIITVSNREPYIHNAIDGEVEILQPASGLVSALEPVMRACGGTWIAHGSGSADRQGVDSRDRIAVPPERPRYTLRRIWITDEEQQGYYYGLSNEGLWPLCHIAYVRPVFREEDWRQYNLINERFARAVVDEASQPDPIILIQDYHFALLPGLIRKLLPNATIITFWHIPWPNAETFGICPWKKEILQGLLGSTILGFHTRNHCNNFIDTVDRYIESRIDRETASITLSDQETYIRPYPISIEWPPTAMENQVAVGEARRRIRERYGLAEDARVAVGVERFDYTKGLLDRMRAVDALLTNFPEWRGKFVLLQIAAPSRSVLGTYRDLQTKTAELTHKINSRYGDDKWQPIKLVAEHRNPHEVFEAFRAADVCIVSSLHDGMNLVAKEFVASRDDEQGVLLLSNFAGASRELAEALIVNPFDTYSTGEQLHRALTMPPEEQAQRMRLMREQIRTRNVYRWAGKMLLDAEQWRKKQKIARIELEYESRR